MTLAAFFSQLPMDPTTFAQYGLLGLVLAWFMLRLEKKIERHTAVINDLVEAITIEVLSRKDLHEGARTRAEHLLERTHYRSSTAKAKPGPACETI